MIKLLVDQSKIIAQQQVRMQIALSKEFDSLKDNIKDWSKVQYILSIYLQQISRQSYREGCQEIQINPDALDIVMLKRNAIARAEWVANQMKTYTLKSLDIEATSKKSLLGKKRAKKTSEYETGLTFYNSRQVAWKKNREVRKSWVLANEHDLDDHCDDNLDDGAIPIDEPFTTGDFVPPAHIGCYCKLFIHVPQGMLRTGLRF